MAKVNSAAMQVAIEELDEAQLRYLSSVLAEVIAYLRARVATGAKAAPEPLDEQFEIAARALNLPLAHVVLARAAAERRAA